VDVFDGDDVLDGGDNGGVEEHADPRLPTTLPPRRYEGKEFLTICGRKGKDVKMHYGDASDVCARALAHHRPVNIRSRSAFFMMPGFQGSRSTYDMMHVVAGVASSVIALVTKNDRAATMPSVFFEKQYNGYVCMHVFQKMRSCTSILLPVLLARACIHVGVCDSVCCDDLAYPWIHSYMFPIHGCMCAST
jgi:hypothetical protein